MAVLFDAATTANLSGVDPGTFEHTCTGANLLLVCVGMRIDTGQSPPDYSVSGVTYGGIALTQLDSWFAAGDGETRQQTFYLTAPPGSANTVSVDFSATPTANVRVAIAASFRNARVANPFGTSASAGANNPSVDVSSDTVGMVADFCLGKGSPTTGTPGTGQTSRASIDTGDTGSDVFLGHSTEPGAATVTMSWTETAATVRLFAVPINAGPAGGSQVVAMFLQRWRDFMSDLKRGLVPPDELRRRYREVYAI